MFELVSGDPPKSKDLDMIEAAIGSKPGLSKGKLAFSTAEKDICHSESYKTEQRHIAKSNTQSDFIKDAE